MEWFKCPVCGKNLVQIAPDAVCQGVYIKCKKCPAVVEVKIARKEPEPLSLSRKTLEKL